MCDILHVPLRPDKTVTPCRSLCFLGVELDVVANEVRLPPEKIRKAREELLSLIPRRKAPLRVIQACIGRLNFACIAVPPGRPFLRRLSDLCIGVRRPHHRVSINRAARLDMRAWIAFLSDFNGRSMLIGRRWHTEPELLLETDAAGAVGFGAGYGSQWLMGDWPASLIALAIAVKELVAVVVAIGTWRNQFAHRCVRICSDNIAVVECINYQSEHAMLLASPTVPLTRSHGASYRNFGALGHPPAAYRRPGTGRTSEFPRHLHTHRRRLGAFHCRCLPAHLASTASLRRAPSPCALSRVGRRTGRFLRRTFCFRVLFFHSRQHYFRHRFRTSYSRAPGPHWGFPHSHDAQRLPSVAS